MTTRILVLLGLCLALGPLALGSCGWPSLMVSSVAAVSELGNLVLDNDEPAPAVNAETAPEAPAGAAKDYAKKEEDKAYETESGT